jgi:hypothetical protein
MLSRQGSSGLEGAPNTFDDAGTLDQRQVERERGIALPGGKTDDQISHSRRCCVEGRLGIAVADRVDDIGAAATGQFLDAVLQIFWS